jgi:hypothetical protein
MPAQRREVRELVDGAALESIGGPRVELTDREALWK